MGRPPPAGPVKITQEEIDHRLHVSQGAIGAKLVVVLGSRSPCRAFLEASGLRDRSEFVALVLHRDPGPDGSPSRSCATHRGDRRPGSARCAGAHRARLRRQRAGWSTRSRNVSRSRRSMATRIGIDLLDSVPRSQRRLRVAGQPHEGAGEAAVEGTGGERGHARDLHRTVKGLVVVPKALVMRTVPRLVRVQQGDDESGPSARPARPGSSPECTRRSSSAGSAPP